MVMGWCERGLGGDVEEGHDTHFGPVIPYEGRTRERLSVYDASQFIVEEGTVGGVILCLSVSGCGSEQDEATIPLEDALDIFDEKDRIILGEEIVPGFGGGDGWCNLDGFHGWSPVMGGCGNERRKNPGGLGAYRGELGGTGWN